MHNELILTLKSLKMHHSANVYQEFSQAATKKGASYEEFLLELMRAELVVKEKQKIFKLKANSKIPIAKTVETYEHDNLCGFSSTQLNQILTGQFLKEAGNIVFFGPCGVGKTHLAIGITTKLCELGFKCLFKSTAKIITELMEAKVHQKLTSFLKKLDTFDLIVLDELGYVPTDPDGATLLFQLISDRSERKSLLITTNLAYSEWGSVFGTANMTAAAIDRIIYNCETYNIHRDSWRVKQARKKALPLEPVIAQD